MTKVTELLINIVIMNRLKLLISLTRNMGRSEDIPLNAWEYMAHTASGEKAGSKLSISLTVWNVVSLNLLRAIGKPTVRKAHGRWR